jgi:acyl carrier protein
MEIEKTSLETFIIKKLEFFAKENEIETENISCDSRLIGSHSLFDSIDLVRFIVELEEELEEEFSIEISLMDEKAMSSRTSPFINAHTLSNYIKEYTNEN